MKSFITFLLIFFAISCQPKPETGRVEKMDRLAQQYVRLGLTIGQYDSDFVDAYYGPDSLKPAKKITPVFPKDSLLAAVKNLSTELKGIITEEKQDTVNQRGNWMVTQLTAFERRIKIFSGEYTSFDEESRDLFGVAAPVHDEAYFRLLLGKLDSLLPGKGELSGRFQQLANRFVIPKAKIDTVFKRTIAEARKRTLSHYKLPANESFSLEYVTGKPWSGYNWYKGGYNSIIQINTDLPIGIERAVDLACHEGYPGHHVYNMLIEKNFYRDRGWVEVSLYPLFSPQSLIAEGSANFGIEVAFPGTDQNHFIREELLPLAGLDTAGLDDYLMGLSLKNQLNFARNEAARGLLKGTMSDTATVQWLVDYGLNSRESAVKSISFIKKYRSYVINYNYGLELVKNFIAAKGGIENAPEKRWEVFEWLLSNQVAPQELLKVKP
ncbi:MAG: hypothetical protein WKI04_13040 [Ferruginibacter sp.]